MRGYNIGYEILHVFLVHWGKFCVLMILRKIFVNPFVFLSAVGAKCESTFSTGSEGGVAGWERISNHSK